MARPDVVTFVVMWACKHISATHQATELAPIRECLVVKWTLDSMFPK